jgi:hypothetical protein
MSSRKTCAAHGNGGLNLYPLPNLKNETNNNYLLQYARLNPRQTNVGKVDWNIDDKTRAYVRYSQDMGTIRTTSDGPPAATFRSLSPGSIDLTVRSP